MQKPQMIAHLVLSLWLWLILGFFDLQKTWQLHKWAYWEKNTHFGPDFLNGIFFSVDVHGLVGWVHGWGISVVTGLHAAKQAAGNML